MKIKWIAILIVFVTLCGYVGSKTVAGGQVRLAAGQQEEICTENVPADPRPSMVPNRSFGYLLGRFSAPRLPAGLSF